MTAYTISPLMASNLGVFGLDLIFLLAVPSAPSLTSLSFVLYITLTWLQMLPPE